MGAQPIEPSARRWRSKSVKLAVELGVDVNAVERRRPHGARRRPWLKYESVAKFLAEKGAKPGTGNERQRPTSPVRIVNRRSPAVLSYCLTSLAQLVGRDVCCVDVPCGIGGDTGCARDGGLILLIHFGIWNEAGDHAGLRAADEDATLPGLVRALVCESVT